jgi:hypothetical protein
MDLDDFINNEMGEIKAKPSGGASKPSFGAKKPSMGMASKALPSDFSGPPSASKPSFGGKPSFAKKPGMGAPRRNDIDDLLSEEADILSGSRPQQ